MTTGISSGPARENAMRNPRRTASTASALMIGLGLVAFVTIFAASLKASASAAVDEMFTAENLTRTYGGQMNLVRFGAQLAGKDVG